jgi:hypothetical protein
LESASGALVQPVQPYNINPLNYYLTSLERTQATSLGNFKINEHAEAYAELFYTGSKVGAALAETGTFGSTFNVPIGNPFIPAAARTVCARRGIGRQLRRAIDPGPLPVSRHFVEAGPLFDFDNKTLQYTVGLKGALYNWTYDAYWSRGAKTRPGFVATGGRVQVLASTRSTAPAASTRPMAAYRWTSSAPPVRLRRPNLPSSTSAHCCGNRCGRMSAR